MPEKHDAEEIRAILAQLRREPWLGAPRAPWPNHIYHFTDVQNAARIIRGGRIYSRRRAAELGDLQVDIAATGIVGGSPWTHDHARFYFRPATPTQYHNEGIRPLEHRSIDSHCPVPVFFIFDAAKMLTLEGAEFTDGNFARHRFRRGSDATFLRGLNFRAIYHDSAYPQSMSHGERDEITRSRCAEILFPDEVDLTSLLEVVCRTPAERQTLLTLLGPEIQDSWRDRIRIDRPGERLFYRDWAYVRDAAYTANGPRLSVMLSRGRYEIRARTATADGDRRNWKWPPLEGPGLRTLIMPNPEGSTPPVVLVRAEICGCLAYQGYLNRQPIF